MGLSLLATLLSGRVSCRKRADDQHRVTGLGYRARGRVRSRAGPAATSSAFIPARLVHYALGVVGRVAVAHAVLTGHSVTAARREAVHVLVDE